MDARAAIREIIEAMPNFFGHTRSATIGAQGETETIVYTQPQIADLIAAILPDRLKGNGHLAIQLPAIETDDAGRRYVRVPITARPWADGEVRISPRGDEVAIANTPPILPIHDTPALATALMAAWATRPTAGR
ncbi:Uncharacterised protein [Mycolicibacterium phlei]|uniref:hypothetical protein n=1 Tax=Mycobacteroides chelonae TaxID=1774 RepID=UPI000618B366|nr:hypothetical protein [Mycobacteroides chelonae]VEG16089.1 Uncharacterised protein [Mycolicibacterium phlei]AKC38713.1 hypothetical protein GR01_09250 [Mycobacteroides chelonae]ANA97972.1 hypothetical protein BB28_09765 [Mycobacteroides chelonae CCUG 47445]OLT78067.1 hypothetical protein BKG56_13875 [Mycobacteroides chelonae]ORV15009.1 hypothetical protein AWB96_10840 [Mycobacteroides chelonae]